LSLTPWQRNFNPKYDRESIVKTAGRYEPSTYDNIVGFQDDFGLRKEGFLARGEPTELAMTLAHDAKRTIKRGHSTFN
jgi:hypothetical protein